MKNDNVTLLDPNQVSSREHSVEHDAKRVVLVGGENITLNADVKIPEQKIIEIPVIVKEYEKIEIPIIVQTEVIKEIQIPMYFTQIEYKEIEKPVVVQTTEYKTIEVPVVIKEIEYKEIVKKEAPLWHSICIVVQTLAILGYVLSHLK